MRKKILIIAIFILFLSACGSTQPESTSTASPEPTPSSAPTLEPSGTPTPTEEVKTSGDPVWDRVTVENQIIFGTSADYPPFEYYDASFEIIGFDAALARQLGAQLGLDVQLLDIAFEGLPAALESGQIDAAIAAISVTPERMALMDFTNVYYSGQDAILAREGSGIPPIITAAQLAQYRVGTQRGSVYESWIQKTLIDAGLMPVTNLKVYERAQDAVRDLRENFNDLVVLDKLAADEYLLSGGVDIVGENLNRQLFAIAIPKSSSVLQNKLNQALTTLQNNGTLAQLTDDYLDVPVPVKTPTPQPTPTALPGPTPTPPACYDGMAYVSDVQIPDGTELAPGKDFDKVWRIRNTGTCSWNSNYRIVFVQGDRMEGGSEAVKTIVRPGETYDIIIDQKAPTTPGKYTGIWQMVNASNIPFGERVWVKITVPGPAAPTNAPPTNTPVPQATPTSPPTPTIDYLNVSSPTVSQGDLLIVSWSYSGQSITKATLTRTNPDGTRTVLYGGANVDPQSQYEDLMMNPGNYSYTLFVENRFGNSIVKTAVVNVSPALSVNDLRTGEWLLVQLINPIKPDVEIPPLNGTEITMRFSGDGSATGNTGCNPFNTSYQLIGTDAIQISDRIFTGQTLCAESIMGQETLFLDLLKSVEEYEVDQDNLVLKAKHPDTSINETFDVLQFRRR